VGRDEMTDREWLLIGALKAERIKIAREETNGSG